MRFVVNPQIEVHIALSGLDANIIRIDGLLRTLPQTVPAVVLVRVEALSALIRHPSTAFRAFVVASVAPVLFFEVEVARAFARAVVLALVALGGLAEVGFVGQERAADFALFDAQAVLYVLESG